MQRFRWFLVLLVVLGTTGCGLLGSAAERRASLTISNYSNWPICSVYVAPHQRSPERRTVASFDSLDEPAWSENLLGEQEIIDPGYMRSVPIEAGRWDLRMDDCRGRPLYARRGMLVSGTAQLDFRPIRVERPTFMSRRRVATDRARAPTRF